MNFNKFWLELVLVFWTFTRQVSIETRTYFDKTFAYNKLDPNQSKVTKNY